VSEQDRLPAVAVRLPPLEVVTAEEPITYSRAAGALEAFVADHKSTTYNRAAGASAMFTVDLSEVAYKHPSATPKSDL
jgi:hypothetical protein